MIEQFFSGSTGLSSEDAVHENVESMSYLSKRKSPEFMTSLRPNMEALRYSPLTHTVSNACSSGSIRIISKEGRQQIHQNC